jgi:hypothetical protein
MSEEQSRPVAPSGEPMAGTEPAEDADVVGDEVREDPGSAGDTAVVEDGQSAVTPADPDAG